MFQFRTNNVATEQGSAALSFLVCRPLEDVGFLNAFSTRNGGVSPFPQRALNLNTRDDAPSNLAENRRRFLAAIGAEGRPVLTARQKHSADRCAVPLGGSLSLEEPEGDAFVSKRTGVLLGIKTADCLPILIGDPESGAMAAVHAGWRGTAARITEMAVADLKRMGAHPNACIAALGPSACGECYEVGPDVIDRFRQAFGASFSFYKERSKGKYLLDIPTAQRGQLLQAGLAPANIHLSNRCTIHENDLFFSYRAEGETTGRLLSVIGR